MACELVCVATSTLCTSGQLTRREVRKGCAWRLPTAIQSSWRREAGGRGSPTVIHLETRLYAHPVLSHSSCSNPGFISEEQSALLSGSLVPSSQHSQALDFSLPSLIIRPRIPMAMARRLGKSRALTFPEARLARLSLPTSTVLFHATLLPSTLLPATLLATLPLRPSSRLSQPLTRSA